MPTNLYRIIVYLDCDYIHADEFWCSNELTKEQITNEVNERYEKWCYYDIQDATW